MITGNMWVTFSWRLEYQLNLKRIKSSAIFNFSDSYKSQTLDKMTIFQGQVFHVTIPEDLLSSE